MKVPYVSDSIDRKIVNAFRKEGFPVRMTHKGKSLRQALTKKEHLQRTCTRIGCTISDSDICSAEMWSMKSLANGVPTSTSAAPSGNYMTASTSTRNQQALRCLVTSDNAKDNYNIHVGILAHDNDTINLRLKEAIQIRNKQLHINSRE